MRVAIVGAGPAGLVAGDRLALTGARVTVFDKGRRPGGRLNTREHGEYRFDHGAPFFTVRDARIQPYLDDWVERGVAHRWDGELVYLRGDQVEAASEAERFVGTPEMISIPADLARGLDVRCGLRIAGVSPEAGGLLVTDDAGTDHGVFDRIVVAVPAPQAAPLLASAPRLQQIVAQVEMSPCWAAMFTFEERPPMPFDGAFVADGPMSWIARERSKPGRPCAEAWVIHARPEWTCDHLDVEKSEISGMLLEHLAQRFGPLPEVTFARAHRWGFALASESAPGPLYDAEAGMGAVGDWSVGGSLEGALISGLEVAERLLDH